MISYFRSWRIFLLVFAMVTFFYGSNSNAQPVVGLDNWFNYETHPKTGFPFHYLWNDTLDSGFSRWGDIFRQKGAKTLTLYKPDAESLGKIDVYIIVDPDSIAENPKPNFITSEDIKVIVQWVKKGGVLVLMANDGKHCGLSHLNNLSEKFGMTFRNVMLHPVINNQYEMGAYTNLPRHPVFKDLTKIYMKEVASISISGYANAVLSENGETVIAEATIGKGFVFAIGDPWIYNEYIDHDRLPADFENRKAAENLSDYLLSKVHLSKTMTPANP